MKVAQALKSYRENSQTIRRSFNNPLKKTANLSVKDDLERNFYDDEAQKHLDHFDESLFRYDENESMPASHRYFYSLLQDIRGKRILDICCGYGFTSVRLAQKGALVTGIDISPKMVRLAEKNAAFNKCSGKMTVKVMSVQSMQFKECSFDYVVGLGALHHLNLALAAAEISRILKKGGRAFFMEPRLPFKWLIVLRSLLPNKCYESPGGSQLSDREVLEFSRKFSQIRIDYFMFLRKLARLPLFNKISGRLDQYDEKLIKEIPGLYKFYWAYVLQFTK